jgi:hypothetical protein
VALVADAAPLLISALVGLALHLTLALAPTWTSAPIVGRVAGRAARQDGGGSGCSKRTRVGGRCRSSRSRACRCDSTASRGSGSSRRARSRRPFAMGGHCNLSRCPSASRRSRSCHARCGSCCRRRRHTGSAAAAA